MANHLAVTDRGRPRFVVVALVALGLLSACEVADPTPAQKMVYPAPVLSKSFNDIAYGDRASQVLDVYLPSVSNGGAIVWVHGGGWSDSNGDSTGLSTEEQSGFQPMVQQLVARGWTLFSVRFAGTDEAVFPAQIHDVKTAIRWVKAHGPEFGVSRQSVLAAGWSSGGHLAALAATSSGSMEPAVADPALAGFDSRPAAALSIAGVLDPTTFADTPGLGNNQGIADLVGCPATPGLWNTCNPGLLAQTAVSAYADEGDAPIYIAQGDSDGIVDVESQALVPYRQLVERMGNNAVWLDLVSQGDPALYGGLEPRNHTTATSYEMNAEAVYGFVDRFLPAQPGPPSGAALVTVVPCRLGDMRIAHPFVRLNATTVRVQVTGHCGVPAGATSVVLTTTVVSPLRNGVLTVYPARSALPATSTINFMAGDVRANTTIARLSPSGAVDIAGVGTGSPVVLDVSGAFVPGVSASAGRFQPVDPVRALDTRDGDALALSAGTTTTVDLTSFGVPNDALAVAVNVTGVSDEPGFLTVYPHGAERPVASVVNFDRRSQVRSGSVIVPVSNGGLDVFQHASGHLVIDLVGWFTGPSAPLVRNTGMYEAITPTRLLDTRLTAPMTSGATRDVAAGSVAVLGVATNITIVDALPGFISAYPRGHPLPAVSSVNSDGVSIAVANLAVTPTNGSTVSYYSSTDAQLIVDLLGWFRL